MGLFQWLPLANGGRRRETAGAFRVFSRRLPPLASGSHWNRPYDIGTVVRRDIDTVVRRDIDTVVRRDIDTVIDCDTDSVVHCDADTVVHSL